MKKFVFPLENVLSYKKESLEMLRNEMAQLRQKIRDLEDEIAARRRESAELNRALAVRLQTGMETSGFAAYKRYFRDLDRRVDALEARRAALLREAAAKQEEIVRMNSDISGLEKLREKQFKAYEAEDRKEQEQFVEEFVTRAKERRTLRPA